MNLVQYALTMVAGLVANMLEERPELTPDQVKGILMGTARKVGAGNARGLSRAEVADDREHRALAGDAQRRAVEVAVLVAVGEHQRRARVDEDGARHRLDERELTVFAAASLTDAFTEIGQHMD